MSVMLSQGCCDKEGEPHMLPWVLNRKNGINIYQILLFQSYDDVY